MYVVNVVFYRLAFWVKNLAVEVLKCFPYFFQEIGFDISCKLSSLYCMLCRSLFSEQNKNNMTNLSSVEYAYIAVEVK